MNKQVKYPEQEIEAIDFVEKTWFKDYLRLKSFHEVRGFYRIFDETSHFTFEYNEALDDRHGTYITVSKYVFYTGDDDEILRHPVARMSKKAFIKWCDKYYARISKANR